MSDNKVQIHIKWLESGQILAAVDRVEIAAQLRRLAAVEAERDELLKNEQTWKKQCDTLTHQVICCGVAASHSDATLTTRGAYTDKWNSKQAEEVRALRAERDTLRAELERIRALEPVGLKFRHRDSDRWSYCDAKGNWPLDPAVFTQTEAIPLYALTKDPT